MCTKPGPWTEPYPSRSSGVAHRSTRWPGRPTTIRIFHVGSARTCQRCRDLSARVSHRDDDGAETSRQPAGAAGASNLRGLLSTRARCDECPAEKARLVSVALEQATVVVGPGGR